MAEVQDALPDLDPRSMFDFGSGPGTATLAAWDVWGAEGGNVESSDGEERWEEGIQKSENIVPHHPTPEVGYRT